MKVAQFSPKPANNVEEKTNLRVLKSVRKLQRSKEALMIRNVDYFV